MLWLYHRRLAGMCATEATCERVFSAAGRIMTEERTRLSHDNIEMLLFCEQNYSRLVRFEAITDARAGPAARKPKYPSRHASSLSHFFSFVHSAARRGGGGGGGAALRLCFWYHRSFDSAMKQEKS